MEDCKESGTPMQSNIKLQEASEEERKEFKSKNLDYRSAVGSLNYLSQCTRPDITYTVGKLSQFLENHGEENWSAFKQVLQYLKGTKTKGLLYKGKKTKNKIVGYVDSSWCEDNHSQSTSGMHS